MNKSSEKVLKSTVPDTIRENVEAIAKGLGVAAIELWGIFVRQYIVKGITEVFTALVLIGAGLFLAPKVQYWSLFAFGAALPFCYGAIMLLGNPKYWAIQDITRKTKELK